MKTTELHQEYITDEYSDTVKFASEIIGFTCSETILLGDRAKGDEGPDKYQIIPDPYSASNNSDRINLAAFENYFYDNFGKWKDRCYFDTPSEAFYALMKAWHIWHNHLEHENKSQYIKQVRKKNNV